MHLDGSLGRAKARPRKDAQAEVDGCSVECIDRLFEFDSKTVLRVELARHLDLTQREILIDMPVARFVGVGERAPGGVATNAQMIESGLVSAQTGFDVAKALAVRQLREGQAEKLIEMRKFELDIDLGIWLRTDGTCAMAGGPSIEQTPVSLRAYADS